MFIAKTEKIRKLAGERDAIVKNLELLFENNVGIYIDYANVRPWSTKLGWNIELKRLKQFLDSFENIKFVKVYNGTLKEDEKSEELQKLMKKIFKDGFKTKPVKIMKRSIDYSSIKSTATDLLDGFIRRCLLRKYDIETIEYLNEKFREMNQKGIYYISDLKCNFDVEIGRDMLLDYEKNTIDTYVLWSGDSDFYDPIAQLLNNNKKVILFATTKRVASELDSLQKDGLIIFDIKKIKEFICWNQQILKAKRTP